MMHSWFSACAKLMLSKILHLWFLLFESFVCCQNVTFLKRFTRYRHYTDELLQDNHSQTLQLLIIVPNITAFSCSLMTLFFYKVVGFVSLWTPCRLLRQLC